MPVPPRSAPQKAPEPLESAAHARLHGAERLAEARGDLRLREPVEVRELEDAPLGRRQVAERPAERRARLRRTGRALLRDRLGQPIRDRPLVGAISSRLRLERSLSMPRLRVSVMSHASGVPRSVL